MPINHITRRLAAMALLAASAAALSTAALAQPAHNMHDMPAAGKPAGTAPGQNVDMKAMMQQMSDASANMPMTGDPDIDFAMMMRIHHLGAVDMAQAELRDGRNPQMRKLAQDIIMAQKKEIAVFEKFLAKKGHSVKK